ncbi:MAG: hypothetical protein KC964_17125, partial [Candidatus Omnitrophica bacterium]|nr:hypothetical protein [Candidatus Omnitrophota bacterium]
MFRTLAFGFSLAFAFQLSILNGSWAGFSLDQARLLSRGGEIPTAEQTAAEVLVEELKGRFNIDLK